MNAYVDVLGVWIPVVAVLVLTAGTILMRGPRRMIVALLAVAVATLTFAVQYVETERWGYLLAAIPAVLILQHAVSLALFRSRYISLDPQGFERVLSGAPRRLHAALESAWDANQRYFSPEALVLRFWIPGLFVAFVGVALVYKLFSPTYALQMLGPTLLPAARLGAAGAYVYVLLTLGQRTLRSDISSGTATWCAVTLALGPILAVVLAYIWRAPAKSGEDGFLSGAAYFMSGFAPRYVANVIQDGARKFWSSARTADAPTRLIPLVRLRGIDAEVAERLSEEGAIDVSSLAMLDPHKLLRNTGYDKRQILAWIDEALLVYYMPDGWDKLARLGITGAIDLAVYGTELAEDEPDQATTDFVEQLAVKADLEPVFVRQVIVRMYEDAQVQLVWVLYQFDSADVASIAPMAATSS